MRFLLHQLAVNRDGRRVVFTLLAQSGQSSVDVEPVRRARVALEFCRLLQGLVGVHLVLFAAKFHGLRESPVAHRAVRVDANTLLECFGGFVVPEVVQKAQPLVEPRLSLRRGLDRDVRVADPRHADGHGQLVGRREGVHAGHGRHRLPGGEQGRSEQQRGGCHFHAGGSRDPAKQCITRHRELASVYPAACSASFISTAADCFRNSRTRSPMAYFSLSTPRPVTAEIA